MLDFSAKNLIFERLLIQVGLYPPSRNSKSLLFSLPVLMETESNRIICRFSAAALRDSDGARDRQKNGTGHRARKDHVFAMILSAAGFGFCEAHDVRGQLQAPIGLPGVQ
jgi:hypothetical protein